MEDKQQENPEKEKGSSQESLAPKTTEHIVTVEIKPETEGGAAKADDIKKEHINVIVNVPEQDNTIGLAANRIASKSNRIAFYAMG